MKTHEQIEIAQFFAGAKIGARHELSGKTFSEALSRGRMWFPTLGGKYVSPSTEGGFSTKEEALADAIIFRTSCQKFLKETQAIAA